jgi:hypothetical protein
MRGIAKVEEQCLLTAAVQNMKRIARILWKKEYPSFSMLLRRAIRFFIWQSPLNRGLCQ